MPASMQTQRELAKRNAQINAYLDRGWTRQRTADKFGLCMSSIQIIRHAYITGKPRKQSAKIIAFKRRRAA